MGAWKRQLFLGGAVALSIWISPTSPLGSPLLLSRLTGAAAPTQAEDVVEELGGRVLHSFPPDHLIVDLEPQNKGALADRLGSAWTSGSGEVVSPRAPAHFAFNRLIGGALALGSERADDGRGKESYSTGRPLAGDYFLPPPGTATAAKSAGSTTYGPYGAGFWDGSEFLLGSIGVAVVMPESNGAIDPSTEDWSADEKAHVAAEVAEAMNWWLDQTEFEPLSFTYEFHYDVPVSYEPITRPQSQEALWIEEALAELGYSGSDRFTESQRFVNDLKSRLGTDWGFIIYVVDSSNDADGMFSSGHFAYAYLGGPFLVLTLTNDGWGAQNFAAVCAHETGHIFYALDEYYSAGSPCTDASGYLRYENQNSQYGSCAENVEYCIMRSVPLQLATLCSSTKGHVGWVDADADGVPNVAETAPAVQIISVGKNGSSLVEGSASVSPLNNLNPLGYGNDVSINTIDAVEFQLDGGGWQTATPVDGAWDGGSESFTFQPLVADSGTYHMEVRALNSTGIFSAAVFEADIAIHGATGISVTRTGAPGTLRLLGNRPNPFNPSTEIHFHLDEGGEVAVAIYDARGAMVDQIRRSLVPMGDSYMVWSGTDRSGHPAASGRYFYTIRSGGSSVVGSMLLLR